MRYGRHLMRLTLEDTLSFTLPLELPKHGGGLFVWDWMNMDDEYDC